MEFKGTKGGWYMNVTKAFVNNKGLAITDENNKLICEINHDSLDMPYKEYEANAKIIVCAPEMFDALVSIYNKLGTVYENEKQELKELIEKIR